MIDLAIDQVQVVTVCSYEPRAERVNDLLRDGWCVLACTASPASSESDASVTFAMGLPRTTKFGRVAA